MKALILTLTLMVTAAISWAAGTANATPQPHHGWHQWNAVIRCDEPMEEDGFAHVRLAIFDSTTGKLVYRCVKEGW